MKKRRLVALGMCAAMAMSLAACGGSSSETETTAAGGEAAEGAETAGGSGEKLIIYTNSGSDERDVWLEERAAQDGFDVEVVHIQAGDLGNRIVSEKNNVQADLVFGLNNVEYEKLKKEDTMVQWEPEWADEVDLSLGDSDGYFYPIVIQPLVNIMNEDLENPPKDYLDLLSEEWTDKYTILNFGGGTGKTMLAGLLVRFQDPEGEMGISEEGWETVKQWVQNGHMEVSGEDYVGAVIDGTRPICEMWGSGVLQNEEERGASFQIMSPEVGVPYVTEQVAILKGRDNTEAAIEFANWFGSAEIQEEWMNQFGTIPCNENAYANAPENVREFVDSVHQQDIDWAFVAENLDAWVEKVELEYVQ